MWPGWATGGTTTLSFALGFSEDAIPYITIGVLVLIGVVLTVSPVVYQTVEKIQFFMVALIVLFMLYAIFALIGGDGYAALGEGFVEVDKIPDAVRLPRRRRPARRDRLRRRRRVMNLVQSNWVRDKGLGMGAKLPRMVSPFTGEEMRRTDDRLLLPPRRGEHASLERLVEGRQPRAVPDVLRHRRDRAADVHDADLRARRDGRRRGELRLHPACRARRSRPKGAWLGTVFWLIGSVVLSRPT